VKTIGGRLRERAAKSGNMTALDRPRFDVQALRDIVGAKVFARGEAYHRDGQVRILTLEPERVLAQVAGSEDYRTEIRGHGKHFDGECTCRAFDDWGHCKHMVAVVLAANAAADGADSDAVGALSRIRNHLMGKGVDALVEMIVRIAERDPALFRRLDMAAATDDADEKTLETRLRKAIDRATRLDSVDYRAESNWAANVDATLDTLADLASGRRAKLALQLTDRAIDRIEQALGEIDDSDGYGTTLLHRARDIHLAAAGSVRPPPVQFARELFARETADDHETFAGAAMRYANVLGDDGLAEYRRLAAEAWARLPTRSAELAHSDELDADYHRLMYILDGFAERAGDAAGRIALRAKDLSSPWKYLELVEFCLSQRRDEEALRWAVEGLWMFEDAQANEQLVLCAARLLDKVGRKNEAQVHLVRAFEKKPSLSLFTWLAEFGGAAVRDRAIAWLHNQLTNGTRQRSDASVSLLVRILTQEKMFEPAWAAVRNHQVPIALKEALARASEATHAREALETYDECIERLANVGGDRAYKEAAELICRAAALRSAAEQAAYVAALKARFGRKRNFMKALARDVTRPG
jgi:uncharacterized Zn finger protein